MTETMADGEQISHLATMIHSQADSLHYAVMTSSGYLERLQKEIDSGGFASDGTLEILALEKSEQYLRQTADAIEKAKLQLISNWHSRTRRTELKIASGEPF